MTREMVFKDDAPGDTSDGYHTFDELYAHRMALTLALCEAVDEMCDPDAPEPWRSKAHHPDDEPMIEGGYFIVGLTFSNGLQISYHYTLDHWDTFSRVLEHDHAPKWDGHTPSDCVDRLIKFGKGEMTSA